MFVFETWVDNIRTPGKKFESQLEDVRRVYRQGLIAAPEAESQGEQKGIFIDK
jgi:hypothetical protein